MKWFGGFFPNALILILLAVLTTTPTTDAAEVSFHPDAKRFICPPVTIDPTPTRLDSLSLDKGNKVIKYILLEPRTTSRTLCTLTRVNDEFNPNRVYIPIARAYDDNPLWTKSAGKYVSTTEVICGEAGLDGLPEYQAGETLCQVKLDPPLDLTNDGYYLTTFQVGDNIKDEKAIVATFLEKVTFGPTTEEINKLHAQYTQQGPYALAKWLKDNLAKPISSHRAQFRKYLHPRAVESYIYGIPGPRPCERDARFRRFAFTYMDVEISRGGNSPADHTGAPYTKMKIETIQIEGVTHWAVKFGDHVRTVLSSPLEYFSGGSRSGPSGDLVTLLDGQYTLCNAEEVVGNQFGETTLEQMGNYAFQILVGAECSSSYTNRGGEDLKGDGAIDTQQIKGSGSNQLARSYDSAQCNSKCGSFDFARYVKGGNPEVNIPSGFDLSTISYLDLTKLPNPSTQLVKLNPEKFHESSWRMTANLDTSFVSNPPSCTDENGDAIPDAAGLSYNDYFSSGRGKYNLDAPIFAKMPGNKWALHDYRSKFQANTLDNPLADAGGSELKRARRAVNGEPYGDGTPNVDLVTRCSNVEANIFNEEFCQISYDENACETTPAAGAGKSNPSTSYEDAGKYIPAYAGRGVVVCGSDNEVAPDQSDDDYYAVSNRKLNSHRISYTNQIQTVWMEQALYAEDQACQKLAWHLSKIFAYSNGHGEEEIFINTYDSAFVASCASTYAEVVNKMTHNVQMAEQLTFSSNKAAAYEWHRSQHTKKNYPDENYARENMQLHQIGLQKLHEDGSPILDKFGNEIPNYTQENIFAASKIFTGLGRSSRRGNYNDLDRTTTSYLDPMRQNSIEEKDWFPKISFDTKYIGDQYPLCADLPGRHFLQKGAKFVALGGNNLGRYHHDPNSYYLDDEVQKLQLNFEGGASVNPAGSPFTFAASPLFDKICRRKQSFQHPASTLAEGSGQAEYDSSIGAPKCHGRVSRCDSGELLGTRYPNEPNDSHNTIDGCADGIPEASEFPVGGGISDITESVKQIIVEAVGGSVIRGGSWVSIQAKVVANHIRDKVDYYYAADAAAANPEWKFITTVSPLVDEIGEHFVTLPRTVRREKINFRLPNCDDPDHCDIAFRVALRSSRGIRNGAWFYGDNINNDGNHKPYDDGCAKDPYDDTDDLVLQVLPSPRPQDMCDFQATITLDQSLSYCDDDDSSNFYMECHVDTLRVVELLPGVYYEYVRLPCVNMPFIADSDSVKVVANHDMRTAICADKRLASATSSCCGHYDDRLPTSGYTNYTDMFSEYRGERLTFEGNSVRCIQDWGREVCADPTRIGPHSMWTGHCQHHMSCKDNGDGDEGRWLDSIWYHWTSRACEIKVKIDVEGLVAIVHAPDETGAKISDVLPLVDFDKTVSFFSVHWDKSNVAAGKLAYPHASDNLCDGGDIRGDFCFCSTTVQEEAVFDGLPTKAEVIDELHIGAFDPTENGDYVYGDQSDDVKVYIMITEGAYAKETIFQVVNEYNGEFLYLKNVRSDVSVCNGAFKFRSPPAFYNVANPDLVSANQEMEAYLQSVINHDSAPPFTCKSLIKLFGSSNPSPDHVLRCSQAFKSGTFLFSDPEELGATLSFGSGKRSSMQAILAAIVLPPESYSPSVVMDPASGGVQDPFEKVLHVMRSMKLTRSLHHRRSDGLLNGVVSKIGSGCYGPKDQFSFYSSDFVPVGTFLETGLTSPPGELATLNGIHGLSNALYSLLRFGLSACTGGIGIYWSRNLYATCGNYGDGRYTNTAAYLSYSPSEASNVVDDLALLLTSNRLSPENRHIIETQVTLSYDAKGSISEAVQVATILIMSTPEFHTWNTASMTETARTATPSVPKNLHVPYKVLVHVNLFGGMDSMNMLVPHPDGCPSLYEEYKLYRGSDNYVAVTSMDKIDATTSEQPCTHFGVNDELNRLAEMYNEGDAAFFANIGHLQKAVNRYNFQAETSAQLFAHHSMKEEMFKVDAFRSRSGTGVLGRMADVFSFSMAVGQTALDKSPTILKGDPSLANPVKVVKTGGLDPFYHGRDILACGAEPNSACPGGSEHSKRTVLLEKMQDLNAKTQATSSLQAEFWSQSFIDAIAETDSFRSLLNGACKTPEGNDIACSGSDSASVCPNGCQCSSSKCTGGGATIPDSELGKKLDMVFRLIALNEARNVNRDFFAVEYGGFDAHFEMVSGLNTKLRVINDAIYGFRQELKAKALSDGSTLWDKVTLVMSSEFGRSVSPNSSAGTDHGWGGNAVVMGGKVNGGKIFGLHPSTYNPSDDYNTGRGVWIPRTPWESLWHAVVQWVGITNESAINYVLPNAVNFGCNLYAEVDLFTDGTASLSGCGGSVVTLQQSFFVSEARVLIPDEQKAFCEQVVASVAPVEIRCFIQDQALSEVPAGGSYEIVVNYEINFGPTVTNGEEVVTENIDTDSFRAEAASVLQMDGDVVIQQAEVVTVTSSPSDLPSLEPSESPTVLDICTIVTSAIFETLFPNPSALYTHSGFCLAVATWNLDYPDNQIFAAGDEFGLRNQLAAFFGNMLSDLFPTTSANGWADTIDFWTNFRGSTGTGTGKTCGEFVSDGSFGGTLQRINGELECPSSSYETGYFDAVVSRLNNYCTAATAFNVEALLAMDNCNLLLTTLESCTESTGDVTCTACQVWAGVTLPPSSSPSTSIEPSGEPSLNPSLSTMPSGQPSLSIRPSVAIEIASYYGHVLVGDGKCYGRVGGNHVFETSPYNHLEFQSALFVAASLCPRACAAYRTHNKYRGFEFESGKCRCLFDGGIDFSTVLSDHGGLPDSTLESNTAAGTVTKSIGSDLVRCYKKSQPEAPEAVDKFEYIGFGDCWDSSMATYNYIAFSAESNSAVQCGDACALSTFPQSKGFFTKQGTVCNCLFDADFEDASVQNNGGGGTGQVVSSNYVEGHCYRALPVPTNFPTKMPTPKPTPRPTKKPTSFPSSIPSSEPSSQPSSEPSSEPSSKPSLVPSKSTEPSSDPSLTPSKSSQPSSEPSLDPSKSAKPSSSTDSSLSPSTSSAPSKVPSSDPSLSPSKSMTPSESPSSQPSSEPSLDPSESTKPSPEPSATPSKSSAPSTEPSSDPSLTPSKSMRPSRPSRVPFRFIVSFDGTFTITTNTAADAAQLLLVADFLKKLKAGIQSIICPANSNLIWECEIKTLKVNGSDPQRNRLLRSRRSVELTQVVIEFEIIIQAICADSACTDAERVGNILYTSANGDLKAALQDGTFVSGLKADLSTSSSVDDILDAAGLTWNFDELEIPLLKLSKLWYPDWNSGEIRCSNDGKAPNFMTIDGGWWHGSSKEDCCTKYFVWAYTECSGESIEYLPGYYPAWGDIEPRCDTGEPPDYMRRNPKGWIHDTPEECCRNYFGWAPTCVANSGGTAAVDLTASLYYADWSQTNTCVNDGKAPGYVKSSPKIWMYETLVECCKVNYFWGEHYAKCTTPAGVSAPVSSPTEKSWYVDWNNQICVRSCEGPKPCGGVHKVWNILHPTQSICCEEHLWWKKDCNHSV